MATSQVDTIVVIAPGPDGRVRTVMLLSSLSHVPQPGDVLVAGNHRYRIDQTDGYRTRACLTGLPLPGGGEIGVVVNEAANALKARHPRRPFDVNWVPGSERTE